MSRFKVKFTFQQTVAIVSLLGIAIMVKYRFVPAKDSLSQTEKPVARRAVAAAPSPVEQLQAEIKKESEAILAQQQAPKRVSAEEFFKEDPAPTAPQIKIEDVFPGDSALSDRKSYKKLAATSLGSARRVQKRAARVLTLEDIAGPLLDRELSASPEEADFALNTHAPSERVALAVTAPWKPVPVPVPAIVPPAPAVAMVEPAVERLPEAEPLSPPTPEDIEVPASQGEELVAANPEIVPPPPATEAPSELSQTLIEPVETEAAAELVAETRHAEIFQSVQPQDLSREAEELQNWEATAPAIESAPEPEATVISAVSTQSEASTTVPPVDYSPKTASVGAEVANQFSRFKMAMSGGPTSADSETRAPAVVEPETIHGLLTIEDALHDWIDARKGHVELFHHPEAAADPASQQPVSYTYGRDEFFVDAKQLRGKSRLEAVIFTPQSEQAVARIYCPGTITPTTRARQRCHLTEAQRVAGMRETSRSKPMAVPLRLSVFGEAEYQAVDEKSGVEIQRPVPLAGASVRFVNVPELSGLKTDAEGDLRIPGVPAGSTYLVDVSKDGYYPTRVPVVVGHSLSYQAVTLVSKAFVSGTAGVLYPPEKRSAGVALEHVISSPGTAVVVGKAFKPNSLVPQPGLSFSLSDRRKGPLYFDFLPNRESMTTSASTGLFALFGVIPAVRALVSSVSPTPLLMSFLPNYGYLLKFGNQLSRLKAKLTDPLHGPVAGASVRVVGAAEVAEVSDDTGSFEISGITNPPGSLLLEIEAEGYGSFWYTLPVSPGVSGKTQQLFVANEDLIEAALQRHSKLKRNPALGTLLGGADRKFFPDAEACVYVSLETVGLDPVGKKVLEQPLPLTEGRQTPRGLCLTQATPGFLYPNLPDGEYTLRWSNAAGQVLRMHHTYVGIGKISVVTN